MSFTRRNILQMVPAAAAMSLTPRGFAADTHHVVVVGGGFAGSTVAKYLRMWSNGGIAVTLVEPNTTHISCIMSNLVLNGQLKLSDLSFDYAALQSKYGVKVVKDRAQYIDGENRVLQLESLEKISYDSLVVATGIQFDNIEGLDSRLTPHAWIAGKQTNLLRDQIGAMPDNGTFVMTIPEKPYRCPPGPYERACLVADILGRRSGVLKGTASPGDTPTVVVLDANDGIQAEKHTFERAFEELYGDIVQYIPNAHVTSVDSEDRVVHTSVGSWSGDVLNVIPRHGAPQLLVDSGITGVSRWAPVNPVTYGVKTAGFPGVYVIGDSQGTGQPKSGHMANAQAKVCADAIVRIAGGLSAETEERLNNITTNSACFSPITSDEASWLTAVFKYNRDSGKMGLVPGSLGESHNWNSENYQDMFAWSENLFADTFK